MSMAKNKINLVTHPSHLGASSDDHPLELIIRALSLKHGKEGEWADKYGTDYEDDIISIHHDLQDYYCQCDYEPQEKAWLAANPHTSECFVTVVGALVQNVEAEHPVPEFNLFYEMDDVDATEFVQFWHGGPEPTEEQKARKKAKQEAHESARRAYFKASDIRSKAVAKAVQAKTLKYDPEWSWKYHCNCGHSAAHDEWQKRHEHVKPCDHWWGGQPNFLHKPSGVEVRWYKYIGRDMEVKPNPIPAESWKQIVSLVSEEDVKRVIDNAVEAHASFSAMIEQANEGIKRLRSGDTDGWAGTR
jgi:hypothetical protein